MNVNIQEIQTAQEEWPVMLTPELRKKLLLGKLARAQQAVDLRRKCTSMKVLDELNGLSKYDKQCPHV